MTNGLNILAIAWPIKLEFFPGWFALAAFAVLGLPIVLLGMRSLSGLGPVRKWVAIAIRLAVLGLFILILGGIRLQRQNKNLEVMVLRDISQSTAQVRDYPGKTLQESLNDYLRAAADKNKPPEDRIGVISFAQAPLIDAMPYTKLILDAKAIHEGGNGTDVASAIQLALASLNRDAMHRLVLVWDGNQTTGDLDGAIAAAAAQHVPIDVVPLHYDVQHEVLLDRFVAPTWKRQNEPFTIDVILRSTNATPVTGKLNVLHNGEPMDLDPSTGGPQPTRLVTLQPGLNVEHVRVPSLTNAGVHQFHAVFEGENVSATVAGQGGQGGAGGGNAVAGADTLLQNNTADAFTFVRGKGQVLYVDNVPDAGGKYLLDALRREGIEITDENHISPELFPNNLVQLQNYDAVILANVPCGTSGLSDEQGRMLATYVHDMGGGLVMIGGEDAFGAGGWQGKKLEEVLPVNMDIPAQRQIPKGALVLVMHSCEMPDGNYWGVQCAIKAVETLGEQDEIGVISYAWMGGPNGGGSQWDFPLQAKGDGSRVIAAIKKMQLGDMPSFDDSMNVALNGKNATEHCLVKSNAKQKHVIIISDGDPQAPAQALMGQYLKAQVSVSTVTVYPHMGDPDGLPPTMKEIAKVLKGRSYGPINNNPNQLPQIFTKEATVVRRSLIHEEEKGMPLQLTPSSSEMVKGISEFPSVYGMVLTSRKNNPQIEIPLVAGKQSDPVLAHWQTGLGRAAAYTSDARNKWGANWVGATSFDKFWAQVVRAVARPPMSADFDVQTVQSGEKGKVTVEALNKDNAFLNFLNIRGTVVGPDMKPHDVKLVQTGPGTYSADFDTPDPGNYVVVLNYRGQKGEGGVLLSGVAMNASPELRDLKSNEQQLRHIAEQTGGRYIDAAFDPNGASFFTRDGLTQTASPLPVWDILIPVLLGLILIDVATRRIAWDWAATKRVVALAADQVRAFTLTTRKTESAQTLDALKRVRDEVAEQKFKPAEEGARPPKIPTPGAARPDPKAKFQAQAGVEGDITKVVGGATDKPMPPAPKKIEPKGGSGAGHTGSLLEAKRRAQQQIKQKEQEQ